MRRVCINKSVLKYCVRLYCSDKPVRPEKGNKESDLQESADVITETYEDCAKFEERVIKQISIEKEQDANFQSRLTKECKILFPRSKNASGSLKCDAIRIGKMTSPKDSPEWVSCNFDQFQINDVKAPTKLLQHVKSVAGSPLASSAAEGTKAGDAGGSNTSHVPRPVRGEPGNVLLTFIPEEWWRAFIPKTGVTGFGTFLFAFATFLVSKEYYVLEHNYYHGLGSLVLWACGIKYVGPKMAVWLDKSIDDYEKSWNQGRENHKQALEENIINELHLQFQSAGQLMVVDVKRENVLLQLEEEYRKRQMYAYNEVKRRLDYYVAVELVHQRFRQKNLIEYVTREVIKSITPELQNRLIYYSIDAIMQDMENEKNKK